jgi:hypothetical protein
MTGLALCALFTAVSGYMARPLKTIEEPQTKEQLTAVDINTPAIACALAGIIGIGLFSRKPE